MFSGMFMRQEVQGFCVYLPEKGRKPDKASALKQLRTHVALFGAWVTVIRFTPYILHYLSAEKEELKLEF